MTAPDLPKDDWVDSGTEGHTDPADWTMHYDQMNLIAENVAYERGRVDDLTDEGFGTKTAPEGDVLGTTDIQPVTNKTIDIDSNTVSNIEVDNFKATALVTAAEGVAANDNDTTLPTTAAVKAYVDSIIIPEASYPLEVWHDFTTKANGAVGANWDSGQVATKEKSPVGVTHTILDGRFITPYVTAGPAAVYLTAQPSAPITKFTVDFNLSASAAGSPTHTEAVGIIASETIIPVDASAYPNGPLHLVINQTQLKYQVMAGGGALNVGAPHDFVTPLELDVDYHVEIILEAATSRAKVTAPDGVELVFSHADIGLYAANFGTIEAYYNAASTDDRIGFLGMSISTAVPATDPGGTLGPNSVGYTELDITGATPPGADTWLQVNSDLTLSLGTPTGTGSGGGPILSTDISDSGGVGRAVLQATSQAAARSAIGVGGAVVNSEYANVLDYGANPYASGDNVAAFRLAANVTGSLFRPIFIPMGSYNFSSTPFTTGALSSIHVQGSDKINCQLNLPGGGGFIDTPVDPISCHVSDILFVGGANQLRWTYTGVSVHYKKVIRDCTFYHYTNCAVQQNAIDDPYWNIFDCLFWALNCSTSMGIAHRGWPNNNNYYNNSFFFNRVHIKVGRGGPDQKIWNCDFLRYGAPEGYPRTDIWLVPGNAATDGVMNSGAGMTIRDNKFGNEGLDPIDWNCVIADEGAGTYVGDRWPLLNSVSANYMVNAYWDGNDHKTGGGCNNPLVYSTTPNLYGNVIGMTLQPDAPRRLLHLLTATGFNPGVNIVGPSVATSGINQVTLTTAASGSLSGQCPKFLVG